MNYRLRATNIKGFTVVEDEGRGILTIASVGGNDNVDTFG